MNDFLQHYVLPHMSAIWGAIFGAVGALWFYIKSKPKEKLDNEGSNLENAKKSLEISERIAERLEKQLEAADNIILQYKENLESALTREHEAMGRESICKKSLKEMEVRYNKFKDLFETQKINIDELNSELRELRQVIEKDGKNESNTTTNNIHAN